jgi:hypothetical protein
VFASIPSSSTTSPLMGNRHDSVEFSAASQPRPGLALAHSGLQSQQLSQAIHPQLQKLRRRFRGVRPGKSYSYTVPKSSSPASARRVHPPWLFPV